MIIPSLSLSFSLSASISLSALALSASAAPSSLHPNHNASTTDVSNMGGGFNASNSTATLHFEQSSPVRLGSTHATRGYDGGRAEGQFVASLRRRSFRQGPPVQDGEAIGLFDATYPKQELQGILAKYEQASEFLQGIGINPPNQDLASAAENYMPASNVTSGTDGSSVLESSEYPEILPKRQTDPDATPDNPDPNSDDADSYPDTPTQDEAPSGEGGEGSADGESTASSSGVGAGGVSELSGGNDDGAPVTGPFLPSVNAQPGTAKQPLRDDVSGTLDLLYYGPINMGTPAQTLTVDVDTGSADLWVPVNCPDCGGHKQFATSRSSTYENNNEGFSITYGSGQASGTLATDVVSIGGLTVQKQAFGAVNQESEDFHSSPNDGLIGMAFGTIASSRKPTFFENLMMERQLAAPIFSVHLTRNQVTGSEVCFGCMDESKFSGTTRWVPVKSQTYWSVGMDAIVVNDKAAATNIYAAIDTGTTLIYIPDHLAASFYKMIPGSKPATQYGAGFYTFPCSSKPNVELSFNGQRFSINLYDFNLGRTRSGSQDCVGGILGTGDAFPQNLAIVGDEFLKSWYSTYDYSKGARVGFSPSINNQQ